MREMGLSVTLLKPSKGLKIPCKTEKSLTKKISFASLIFFILQLFYYLFEIIRLQLESIIGGRTITSEDLIIKIIIILKSIILFKINS